MMREKVWPNAIINLSTIKPAKELSIMQIIYGRGSLIKFLKLDSHLEGKKNTKAKIWVGGMS